MEDIVGGKAQQSYHGQVWFDTSAESAESNFEVSPSYHYLTARAFKTKLRSVSDTQYWNYSFATFNRQIASWEVWFTCGNSSEPADLYMNFTTSDGKDITKIKLEYLFVANVPLSCSYQVKMSVKTSTGWVQLRSDYPNGYLYNGWYKVRIEKNGNSAMNYSLMRNGIGVTELVTCSGLGSSFSSLASVEWRSTQNPVVSPIVFFDEHTVSLVTIT